MKINYNSSYAAPIVAYAPPPEKKIKPKEENRKVEPVGNSNLTEKEKGGLVDRIV